MPVSAGEIWQLSLIHDTYWHRNVYIPQGEAGGEFFFHAEHSMLAVGQSRGSRCNIYVFYQPTKPSLLAKSVLLPFNLSSWNMCHLGESQPSAEEKCFYFEIPVWINHELFLMSMPEMCWISSAHLLLLHYYLSLRWSLVHYSLCYCLLSVLKWITIRTYSVMWPVTCWICAQKHPLAAVRHWTLVLSDIFFLFGPVM